MRLGIVMSIVSVGLLLAGAFDVLTRFRSTNLTTTLFLKLIMMKLPYVLVATLPLITFITTLVFLYYLSKSNEIVSIFNIGSSLWHVLSPTLISVFVVGAVGVTMVQPISSVLLNNYEKMEIKLLKKKIDPVIRMENGVIVAEDYDDHKRFITAQIVDVPNKTLSNLSIFFIDNFNDEVKGDSNSRIDASSGVIENGVIILKNAKIFRTVVPEIVEEMKLKTNLTINRFVENVAPPESSSFWELPGKIRNLSAAGMYPTKYKLYYFKLFFEPLMMIALSMFAVIFMNRSQERIYGMKKIFIGLGMGFVLYLLSEISIPILTYHGMGPMAATLCPIALIAMLSVFLILHLHEL
ncbi:MAG: LptF/LptG family permease [Rickettsiaceae bacterium]|nr:LptF/LptG family permease [Rickettsiaceae bacterium]